MKKTRLPSMRSNATKLIAVTSAATLSLAALSACGTSENNGSAASSSASSSASGEMNQADQGQWPRTVKVGDQEVKVPSAPKRIVALSTETADLALQLVGPERVVAVTNTAQDEKSGNQIELAKKVENTIANATKPEPEQILSFNPDLVLMTGRHDQEQSAAKLMEGTGVPTAQFASSDFVSPQAVAESITTLGQLLGAEEKAAELVEKLNSETNEALDSVKDATDKPRTLVLFARGGQKMIMGTNSATTNLVELAGGEVLSAKGGRPGAVPADPETIVKLNPDVILIQGFHGAGKEQFADLLSNPALADVPAIKNDRVTVVDAKTTSGNSGTKISQGLKEIAEALHQQK